MPKSLLKQTLGGNITGLGGSMTGLATYNKSCLLLGFICLVQIVKELTVVVVFLNIASNFSMFESNNLSLYCSINSSTS